ncbi:hypothetical protein ACXPWS_28565 [Mycobacterium sp. BMJ-28]
MGTFGTMSLRRADTLDYARAEARHESEDNLVHDYTEVIRSAIADRVHELGGTDLDAQRMASSASFAMITWSASRMVAP